MKYLVWIVCSLVSANCHAQKKVSDFIESTSYNSNARDSIRVMNYYPEGNDFVCVNGQNRYTRALYGGYTDFRLETSDRPIFVSYKKNNCRNIQFTLNGVPLDKTEFCEARYAAGRRTYRLTDSRWGKGELAITAVVAMEEETAVLKFDVRHFHGKAEIEAIISEIANRKLNRNGDMGVEKPGSLEAGREINRMKWTIAGCSFLTVRIDGSETHFDIDSHDAAGLYKRSISYGQQLAGQITFESPDPFINALDAALTTAADGDWDGKSWLHGCVGWRMPLTGWRAAYVADVLGWNDRARTHFDAYAKSQVTDVEPVIPHPSQDSVLNLARVEKKWGTQMYSTGYICRNPDRKNQMHHYDMNLNYIDELLWHFSYDADTSYIRSMWPTIKRHLEWEKRNFDPDDDGLYDAYCCIWASDALYYNSGAVTHSSAYNLRAMRCAARIADMLGEDSSWYKTEAEKTQDAINRSLWLADKGVWAEYQDFMGLKRRHENPAVWTIYTAIDCGAGTQTQNELATGWIDRNIPHIPIKWANQKSAEAAGGDYEVISTSNWMPYSWSINNVAPAEIMHTALAYFKTGRNDEGFRLMKSSILDQMYLGSSPGNFGQLSFYDAARGECYRDFGDVIGITSRALIQGLFGIEPDALNGKCYIRPGFPSEWKEASVSTPYMYYSYHRAGSKVTLKIEQKFRQQLDIIVLNRDREIRGSNDKVQTITYEIEHDDKKLPLPVSVANENSTDWGTGCESVEPHKMKTISLNDYFNSNIGDIFRNRYISPRSPYTTLQIPVQGIGEWCHPELTADIDDSGFRSAIRNGIFQTTIGIPFQSPEEGKNVIYTSLFDNYPDSIAIPLQGRASRAYLLLAGSTNHMQCHIPNGTITIRYTDGASEELILENPYNWCPIEQDYYIDGNAFRNDVQRPYRVHLMTGTVSRNLGETLKIEGVYGRYIEGGAAEILEMRLNHKKQLHSITLRTLSNDVVIGLAGLTLQD